LKHFSQGIKNAEFYADFKTMAKISPEKRSRQKVKEVCNFLIFTHEHKVG
jgi:hypothetical protein